MTDPHCSAYLEYCPATASAFHVEVTRWLAHRTGNALAGVPGELLKERPATQMRSSERHFPGLKKVNNKVTGSRFANHKTHLTGLAADVTVCGAPTGHQVVGLFRPGFPCPTSVGVVQNPIASGANAPSGEPGRREMKKEERDERSEFPPSEFPMGHSYSADEALEEVQRWLGRGHGSPNFYGSFKLVAHAGRIVRLELIVSKIGTESEANEL
jgi:hypothetical protein